MGFCRLPLCLVRSVCVYSVEIRQAATDRNHNLMKRDASWRVLRTQAPAGHGRVAVSRFPCRPVLSAAGLYSSHPILPTCPSRQIQKVSPEDAAVLGQSRDSRAPRSVVAAGLIQAPWQRQSFCCCHHLCPHSRKAFPVSLRIRRLSTAGCVPCGAEKISRIAHDRLCLGDETTHAL